MQKYTVSLGGLETGYMQKLALYLSERLGNSAQVGVIEKADEEVAVPPGKNVWIGSEAFIDTLGKKKAAGDRIILTEEEPAESAGEIKICRYQPSEKLYQKIMQHIQKMTPVPQVSQPETRQKWAVITADVSAGALLAFSLTYALILGETAGVLYLNLSELSGMEGLLSLEKGKDFSDYMMNLREGGGSMTDGYSGRLENIDYLLPAFNPMILHEIQEEDICKMLQSIRQDARYEWVVVAMGNTCPGCQHILSGADRLIHLTGSGLLQECSRKEWTQFVRLCRENRSFDMEQVVCPGFSCMERGIPLLYEWMEGPEGELIRGLIRKGEDER